MRDLSDRLIVTDLDGTFFGPKASLVPRNLEAIERFKAEGGFFTISTGRMPNNLKKPLPQIEELVNAPVGSCNGALLYDIVTKKPIAERFMDPVSGRQAVNYALEHYPDLGVRLSVPQGFMLDRSHWEKIPMLQADVSSWMPGGYIFVPEAEWDSYPWYKTVIRGDSDTLERLRDELEALFSGTLSFSKSGKSFLELQAAGVDKSVILGDLASFCGNISGKKMTVYACGDYENDLAMIKKADVGVCPANALQSVKEAADLCLCSNAEGLIADLIELIEREYDEKH